jgi:hydroxymethylglutaryl-CoA lyase
MDDISEIARMVASSGVKLQGAIAVAFGCPFEGDVSVDVVSKIASRFADLGFQGITLGDTTGMATPFHVRKVVGELQRKLPELALTLHFHNTRGLALVNFVEGLRLGVTSFESSLGGIGGCPFAPGATGNVCTEDLVNLAHELGIETGIDLDLLVDAARQLERLLGRSLPGQILRAGPRMALHDAQLQCAAVG